MDICRFTVDVDRFWQGVIVSLVFGLLVLPFKATIDIIPVSTCIFMWYGSCREFTLNGLGVFHGIIMLLLVMCSLFGIYLAASSFGLLREKVSDLPLKLRLKSMR